MKGAGMNKQIHYVRTAEGTYVGDINWDTMHDGWFWYRYSDHAYGYRRTYELALNALKNYRG